MDKQTLLRKLSNLLDEAARAHAWGSIEIELRDGLPKLLRKTNQEKLTEDIPRAYQPRR